MSPFERRVDPILWLSGEGEVKDECRVLSLNCWNNDTSSSDTTAIWRLWCGWDFQVISYAAKDSPAEDQASEKSVLRAERQEKAIK